MRARHSADRPVSLWLAHSPSASPILASPSCSCEANAELRYPKPRPRPRSPCKDSTTAQPTALPGTAGPSIALLASSGPSSPPRTGIFLDLLRTPKPRRPCARSQRYPPFPPVALLTAAATAPARGALGHRVPTERHGAAVRGSETTIPRRQSGEDRNKKRKCAPAPLRVTSLCILGVVVVHAFPFGVHFKSGGAAAWRDYSSQAAPLPSSSRSPAILQPVKQWGWPRLSQAVWKKRVRRWFFPDRLGLAAVSTSEEAWSFFICCTL